MTGACPRSVRQEPVASIVVPCRDHAAELARCLPSLIAQDFAADFEIVVVDAAADPQVAAVARRHPSVRLVRSTKGLLPGEARNLGATATSGRYLAFIDSDCVAEPGWLASAITALAAGAHVVGGPVLHGNAIHPVAVIDNLMQFSEVPPGRPAGAVALIPSCNMAVHRSFFLTVGGFPRPKGMSACGEDVLFCMCAAEHSPNPLRFDRGMRIRHFGRSGLREMCRHQYRFGRARSYDGLALLPHYRRLGRLAAAMPLVAGRRVIHLVACAVVWQPANVLYMLLFAPILGLGLAAWTYGFWQGCRAYEAATANCSHSTPTAKREIELEQH
jgi:glycosyltransferase involved in cell wall biosynthesis